MGPYALFQPNRHGNGIRPRPYSRNMEIQPFTYDSIKTNGWLNGASLALPHGLGHGWAVVLWDMTWDLIDKYGFNPNLYGAWNTGGNNRALQYVIDGLKLQGCGPGWSSPARRSSPRAEAPSGGADTCTIWATFARRGLGYSAVQGTTAPQRQHGGVRHAPGLPARLRRRRSRPGRRSTSSAGSDGADEVHARGQPGARTSWREPAVLAAGRLQHAADRRPGPDHHAAAVPGPGRDGRQAASRSTRHGATRTRGRR